MAPWPPPCRSSPSSDRYRRGSVTNRAAGDCNIASTTAWRVEGRRLSSVVTQSAPLISASSRSCFRNAASGWRTSTRAVSSASEESSRTAWTLWPFSSPQVMTSSDQAGVRGKRSSNHAAISANGRATARLPPRAGGLPCCSEGRPLSFGSSRSSHCQIAISYLIVSATVICSTYPSNRTPNLRWCDTPYRGAAPRELGSP